MKRRTFISLLAVLGAAGVVQLSGCSASNSTAAGASSAAGPAPVDLLEAIQTRGTLVVATEGAWSPWTYHDESDKLVGYDVEVATALAEKLGVKAEFVEGAWDGLFAGLDSGRYDIVCNGVELTEERALTYDFTVPYGYIHTALAVRSDNADITTFEDLAGKTTANSIASTYMTLAESYGAEVLGIDTLDETIQMLVAGRVDAMSPLKVLSRGYAIAKAEGRAVTTVEQVQPGQAMDVLVADGVYHCRVEEKEEQQWR